MASEILTGGIFMVFARYGEMWVLDSYVLHTLLGF
jgi:hypothetical protein